MTGKRFPKYLSSPMAILWFESDELALMAVFYTLGLLFGWVGWILLFIIPFLYRRLKLSYPRGFLKHGLYFLGIINLKNYPIYQEKEFIE